MPHQCQQARTRVESLGEPLQAEANWGTSTSEGWLDNIVCPMGCTLRIHYSRWFDHCI
jgi:hypothetical protein